MRLLLVLKMANHTLEEMILAPLLSLSHIEHIYILRDYESGIKHDKITFICSKRNKNNNLRHIEKIFKGIKYCNLYKIDLIISVLLYPHGYIAKTISVLTKVPHIHMVVAGAREFWVKGKIIEKFNLKLLKTSYFVTITGNQTKNYLLSNGYASNKLVILPNIPNMCFENVKTNVEKKYDIISFSRIDKNKNISLLIKAISKLKNEFSLKVMIAGDGSELKNLKKMSSDLNLDDIIEFVGYISGNDAKIKAYTNSKIFVSCSKGEGFPVSLLEAMLCGCVPVISNVGDIIDVIVQGENGFIFNDTDNEEELINLLRTLLINNELLESTSDKAIQIKKQISIENNSQIWSDILSRVKNGSI